MRAFEAVARHLSYVRAADELNVTPAAVGQLVRGLEETLGVALFHRTQSGAARLELTEEGRSAIPDLQAGFDLLASAVGRLKASVSRTTVSVTVPPAFADKWLLGRLERFQRSHPHIDLVLDTNGRIVDFNTARVDLGIRFGAGRWPGLSATHLLDDDFFPVCSPALLGGEYPLTSAANLRHHALIHDVSMRGEASFPGWCSWLKKARIKGIDSERGLQVNDSAAVIQAAIAGGGVALGRSSLVVNDLASGRLVRPFGEAQPCGFAYYVVRKEGVVACAAVNAFTAWLLAEAQAGQG
ncbi:bacterial regulatory helix-turn-helix, lysR family protein [Janthinobacterium agaricidamnosum NBRC 102515 = DSM 9628]|uniref:Bacterial regulatory helix-turn-helix, lysR family protein n=1 Tax=Janthinobacterium agaricidamnosum NBRC 102515 = DSM 9628 TaxID=1349767 RepID=W0V0T6_9BURK|nr:bacterial regulatory helix-turn-helix, lysR family protein [Janthinobacterium agaricidamnosum NBRC 102515 = DSM 9628]